MLRGFGWGLWRATWRCAVDSRYEMIGAGWKKGACGVD